MPGRWAAPPAPAMMALRPRSRAAAAYSNNRSGVRCADTTRTSWAIPRESSMSAAPCMVSQSEADPIMIPTRAFIAASLAKPRLLPEQLAQKREKLPGADRRALFQAFFLGFFQQSDQARAVRLRVLAQQFVEAGLR